MPSKIKTKYKFHIFSLISLLFLCMLFADDSPIHFGEEFFKLEKSKINIYELFQSVYYIPNMIIPIISGFIIDYIGLSYVLTGISIFGIVGQLYMFFYILYEECSFEYFFVGKILYSISSETICVSVFSYISIWFQGLRVGKYIGLLIGLNGFETILFTILTSFIFKEKKYNSDSFDENQVRMKYLGFLVVNLVLAFLIMAISIYILHIDRVIESNENRVPVLRQHPDQLLGFWKLLKKSLRQNFVLICLVYALLYCSFTSFNSNIHQLLIITYQNTSCTPSSNENSIEINEIYSVILILLSNSLIMIVPYFVGKYFIQKKKRYLTAFFGCIMMTFSIGLMLTILRNLCADPTIKLSFFLLSLFFAALGFACQYGLLYSSIALFTKENYMGTRFGIIHAFKNFVYFFFINFQFKSYFIEGNNNLEFYVDHYTEGFSWILGMLFIQIICYLFIISRIEENVKNRSSNFTTTEENSTFIKK